MKSYELLEHTADAKFRAYGKTLDEAFGNAVLGMTAIVADPQTIGQTDEKVIHVEANNLQSLLFDLLDQILFLHDTEHFMPAAVKSMHVIKQDEIFVLNAELQGDDAKKWGGNLKAVTYSEMIVEKRKDDTWIIQAVIDI